MAPLKPAALAQVTRCRNCSASYPHTESPYEWHECEFDAKADAQYSVPCTWTPMSEVDVMGMSVRTPGWRYTLYCAWDGAALRPKLDQVHCAHAELFDHRQDHALWDVDNFENENLAGRATLRALLLRSFA